MSLPEICIRRPVLASVLSLLLVLLGLVAWSRLTVREYPNIDQPVVSVVTTYPGASPEIIESQVTQVLEQSIAGVPGIDVMTSASRQDSSRITIRFDLSVDASEAAADVRDRVSRVRGRLPEEASEPVVTKVEADAEAIIYIAFTSDRYSPLELTDIADRYARDRLQNIMGVAEVQILGERRYAMRIWIDRDRLAAYDLTVADIEAAIRRQNLEVPSGRVESVDREFSVLTRSDLATPEEFEAIVVKDAGGFQVTLGDVARAEIGPADERRAVRLNGRNAVTLGVIRQATANPLDIARAVRDELPLIEAQLPDGVTPIIANDTTVFIDRSIRAVMTTIVEAIVLVFLVTLVFLRSWRAALIPLVTIPVSLIATLALILLFGFSINTLTLLALVLAVGMVVDDAIVVLENVHRHIEAGLRPLEAAIKGSREIVFPVIAMTLTLAAVYAPIAMTPGRTGRLFVEFALALAGAVLVSGFVALTLTPMMCSRMLCASHRENRLAALLGRWLSGLDRGYRRTVASTVRRPWIAVILAGIALGGSLGLLERLPRELSPVEDRGYIRTAMRGPEGATIDWTLRNARQVEPIGMADPDIAATFVIAGVPEVTRAIAVFRLKPWEERERSQQAIVAELRPKLAALPGMVVTPSNPPSLGQDGRSLPVQYVIRTGASYAELGQVAARFVAEAQQLPGLVDVDGEIRLSTPRLEVVLDRERIADAGVDVDVVGRTLESLLAGRQVTRFNRNAEQYDVIVQLEGGDRRSGDDLSAIYVRGRDGVMLQLGSLVRVEETVAAQEYPRFNQQRSVIVSAGLAPGTSLGDALDQLDELARRVLPPGYQTDVAGQSREFRQSSTSIALIFALALAFIALLLAAQFESVVAPVVILVTVPLSMAGALLALFLVGGSLNVYSQIGLVTLIGLITKHGILMVEFANHAFAAGKSRAEAIVEAAGLRLRPILMTTAAMVLGAVPLAIATGAGAESRQQIGWVIVGGMTVGTILTLFVLPTVYALLPERRAAAAAAAAPAE